MKKCSGVLLALFIIFGFSLSVSLDTRALQHDIPTIPIASQFANLKNNAQNLSPNSANLPLIEPANIGFNLRWNSSNAPNSSDLNLEYARRFYSNPGNSFCNYDSLRTMPEYNGYEFNFRFLSYRYNYRDSYANYSPECNQTEEFGSLIPYQTNLTSHLQFNFNSLNSINIIDRGKYSTLLPYYYSYDSIYIHDTKTSSSTGMTYHNTLDFEEVVGVLPNKFNLMQISIPMPNEQSTGQLNQGRHIQYKALFEFTSKNDAYLNFSNNSQIKFIYTIIPDGVGDKYYSDIVYCQSNYFKTQAPGSDTIIQLEVTCDLDLPVLVYNGQFWSYLELNANGADFVFDTNAETFKFSSAYMITDYDSTPGGTWGFAPTGNELDSAPGSASSLMVENHDWFSSLTNLFNFNILNPFAPLFNLFTNSDSCVQIPIIAGMLHAESSEYCPWFSGEVRSIVTPVVGLASAMLLFGFFVRWLGASSGNMFEDTTNETVSNFGGKWRRFKK